MKIIRAMFPVITLAAALFEDYVKCPYKVKVTNWVISSTKRVGVNIVKD